MLKIMNMNLPLLVLFVTLQITPQINVADCVLENVCDCSFDDPDGINFTMSHWKTQVIE